jgi:DNA-binding transcriptional MerR regulator
MASEPLTLGQLAHAVGMAVAEVKLYRACGLLQPTRRSPGRHTKFAYHKEHVDRLRFIARASAYGFSMDAVARLVDTSTLMTCGDIHRIAEGALGRMRHLLGSNAPSTAVLKELVDQCTGTGGREDCQVYRALARD